MEENIKSYFETLAKKYENEVSLTTPNIENGNLQQVPDALHQLYKLTSSAKLPFGEIYSIEEVLKQSERSPFKPNWFVFGRDKYFSFWLCSFIEDEEGLSFTYWDHESGNEIDGAVWSDIVSFLEEIQSNYEDYINER
ncbi:hypothetical protein [Clostridium beijerinckii]|uniref:Knr4/Smi1-like domain-containing protein n=1 Tax=Clostridium beijerinckii TaxID=1520 RepID=A0AAX0B809_CLOBE|nr:hypothetical protein [Clostridium beijerinckii]NRT91291.1 hypothetical protein [Clostridium beijerinckii]NYC70817.1 hypothetical protein [Clostridium beijerinckii]